MSLLTTLLSFVFGGALLGGAIASWLAPKYLKWDNTARLGTQMMCDLPVVVSQLSAQLIHAQLIGCGIGAVVFLVLGILASRSRRVAPPAAPVLP